MPHNSDARFEKLWDEYITAFNELADYMEREGLETVKLMMLMEKIDQINSYYFEGAN